MQTAQFPAFFACGNSCILENCQLKSSLKYAVERFLSQEGVCVEHGQDDESLREEYRDLARLPAAVCRTLLRGSAAPGPYGSTGNELLRLTRTG